MLKNIPVNIITGFLGVGKTTAIQQLLKQKPATEKWAVLVNEFGQIGIDQTAFKPEDGVTIKELPGGCICCTMGLPLTMSLVMLLQRSKPDRLIIEPTGIGHPAGIIDTLRSEPFAETLQIQATICLVDPRALRDSKILAHETFQDQINLADVLILNKTDMADQALIEEMEQRANSMFPPKERVIKAQQGYFDISVLDLGSADLNAQYPDAHAHAKAPEHSHSHTQLPETNESTQEPTPGHPVVLNGSGYDRNSYGWRFHADDIFDLDRLSNWCRSKPALERIKGVFRTAEEWVLINQVLGEQVVSPIAWRKDSRLEIVCAETLNINTLNEELKDCLQV
ncbi:GTP-binding protein [Motiliproteus sp. MSK22-1]|uniref:CobW family GTP-binding protein n=1 Tax=Motiliproteus sp. MSK22-1 TaxID=1897630 RepID=UPI000975C9E4|nr:GTP-binding protein [Motiliproteus sp. MSK22-1]OMH38276.1 hypothetical protein BGP75_08510 [Motiliproteus sp. MSK22-1]